MFVIEAIAGGRNTNVAVRRSKQVYRKIGFKAPWF